MTRFIKLGESKAGTDSLAMRDHWALVLKIWLPHLTAADDDVQCKHLHDSNGRGFDYFAITIPNTVIMIIRIIVPRVLVVVAGTDTASPARD